MKWTNMADGDYFSIGMIVACTTCHDVTIQGEVIAFDHGSKLLALKSQAASGKTDVHDVRLLNLNLVRDITVVKEALDGPIPPASNLNLPKLQSRVAENIREKQRRVDYVGVGVQPLAQKLCYVIAKTISEVKWKGEDLIVMDQVLIGPPYHADNVTSLGKDNNEALQYVRKIVEKFHRDQNVGADRDSASPTTA